MFSVSVEGLEALVTKFDTLASQIAESKNELPDMVMAWQREDMNRRYPNQQTGSTGNGSDTFVVTSIWPRGRRDISQTKRRRSSKMKKRFKSGRVVAAGKPILRAELYDKLMARGAALIEKAMRWP